jgi:hypothetical protein
VSHMGNFCFSDKVRRCVSVISKVSDVCSAISLI